MIDKSQWGEGPWQTEPDRVAFEHLGFPCIIHRVESHGGLCGYVAVPPGHPWHGKGDDDFTAHVHGGVTYSGRCSGEICHVAKPGEPDDVWWLGFDMAHSGDFSPALRKWLHDHQCHEWESYKTIDYVRAECESLAAQAKEAAGPRLAPLAPAPPTETVSAIAHCIVSAYGQSRPVADDSDEVTVVERVVTR